MPTKFVPENSVHMKRESLEPPFQRVSHGASTGGLRRRQQWFIVAVPLLLIVLMYGSSRYRQVYEEARFDGQPLLRSTGVVINRSISRDEDGARYLLEIYCQVAVKGRDEPLAIRDHVSLPKANWEKFQRGDRAGVIYQLSRDSKGGRLLECGLAPLKRIENTPAEVKE